MSAGEGVAGGRGRGMMCDGAKGESSPVGADECGNPFWICDSPVGTLEITINLAKPEKDPRDIAAAVAATVGDGCLAASAAGRGAAVQDGLARVPDAPVASVAPPALDAPVAKGRVPAANAATCDLCWSPAGADGPAHLRRSGARVTEVALDGEKWAWWFSPYGYFPEHLIVASCEHRPMTVGHGTIARLLDFSDAYPQWFIGSNADLPIVGGSLLGHDHYQGGGHRFPLMKAPLARAFAIEGLESVRVGIVRWPASVVRLRARDRRSLLTAACRVLDAWRSFAFEECGIRAFSVDGCSFVQHNTANPILWREGDDYVMDLVLRNNRTTEERPFGLFHVPETLFHIKKENIGLIEIMGRAILPARLAVELPGIKDECDRAFYEILVATGVFKEDAAGHRGWEAFIAGI